MSSESSRGQTRLGSQGRELGFYFKLERESLKSSCGGRGGRELIHGHPGSCVEKSLWGKREWEQKSHLRGWQWPWRAMTVDDGGVGQDMAAEWREVGTFRLHVGGNVGREEDA